MVFKFTADEVAIARATQIEREQKQREKDERLKRAFAKHCSEHNMPRAPHCPMCVLRSIERGGGSPLTKGVSEFISANPHLSLEDATRQYWAGEADKEKNKLVTIQ